MKKINILLVLVAFLAGFTVSCSKDEDPIDDGGGGIPIDSIPDTDTTAIADLVLEYPLELTLDEVNYSGVDVTIDIDAIATLFGLTSEEVSSAILGEAGAPEISLFAIGGTSEIVDETASNTNGPWGHWWDANGEVIGWGDDAMVFAEFSSETGNSFYVGQFPGHLTDGMVIEFYEGIGFDTLTAVCHFTITAKAPVPITAEVVNIQELSITVPERATYDLDSVAFDLAQTLTDLGVSSISEATLVGVKDDNSFTSGKTADNGFWIDFNGFSTTYDLGAVYTDYGTVVENYVGIGQKPGAVSEGDILNAYFGFMANDKIELLDIAITVGAPLDLGVVVNTQQVAITVDTIADYSADSVQFDMAQTLTDLGISAMSEIESVVTYNLEGNLTNATATGNDFWYDLDGNYGEWGDNASVYVTWGAFPDDYVGVGQYPGNLTTMVGNTYTVNYGFLANGKVEMLEIAVSLIAAE